MRAREPDREGDVDRDGVRLHYEVFGSGDPTLVLVPSNPIVHSRQWKAQVPYLARRYRVVTFDGRGNGRSDRPVTPEAHTDEAYVADLEAVLAATCPEPAVLIGLCSDGVWRSLWFAADHPERVAGVVALWAKLNRHCWLRDYPGFVEFFFSEMFPEPHSTKQTEDCVGWALETSAEVMVAAVDAPFALSKEEVEAICRRVRAPLLIVHGDDDRCQSHARAERLAELTGAPLITMEGAGPMLPARHPVKINLLIKDFVDHLVRPEERRRSA